MCISFDRITATLYQLGCHFTLKFSLITQLKGDLAMDIVDTHLIKIYQMDSAYTRSTKGKCQRASKPS
jgi:hypothetical protein